MVVFWFKEVIFKNYLIYFWGNMCEKNRCFWKLPPHLLIDIIRIINSQSYCPSIWQYFWTTKCVNIFTIKTLECHVWWPYQYYLYRKSTDAAVLSGWNSGRQGVFSSIFWCEREVVVPFSSPPCSHSQPNCPKGVFPSLGRLAVSS